MIRCIAVDDEAYASAIISNFIDKTPFLKLVKSTTDPYEAIGLVEEGSVDLVFLDIQMPDLSGIQFLKICGQRCKVILTTAYPEYALDGFELDAIDYLLKPISYERFYRAALKAQDFFVKTTAHEQVQMQNAVQSSNNEYIFIKGDAKHKFIKVNYSEILYVEGLKNYVSIYTITNQRIITYQTLRELETQLPQPPFYRVHKSYIVSTANIKMVEGNNIFIDNKAIPVGETYRDEFFRLIRSGHL